jgi:hypothetical protein
MANKPTSASVLKQRRSKLLDHVAQLSQLDLFRELDENTKQAIAELKQEARCITLQINRLEYKRLA